MGRFRPALAPLAIAVGISVVLAACGSGGQETPTTPPTLPQATTGVTSAATPTPRPTVAPPPSATAVPVPTGQFRFALAKITSYAVLPGVSCCTQRYHMDPMYDALVGLDKDGKLSTASGYASSWSVSADALAYTFKLRDGLVFHNGAKATARDFKYSSDWYQSPQANSTFIPANSNIAGTDFIDDSTAVVRIKALNIFTLNFYALTHSQATGGYLLPKDYFEANGAKLGEQSFNLDYLAKHPMGSGPYKYQSDVVNQELAMTAAPGNHWLFGTPRYQTVRVLIVPEDGTREALYNSGGAEAGEVSRPNITKFRQAGFEIQTKAVDKNAYVQFHEQYKDSYPGSGKNPLADVRVRKALSIAVDRALLNEKFMAGQARVTMNASSSPLDPAFKTYPIPKQDLAEAKRLLAEAGFPNGFSVEMLVWSSTGMVVEAPQVMEAIAVWWEGLGLKIDRKPNDSQQTLALMAKGSDHPIISGPWPASVLFSVAGLRPGVSYKNIPSSTQQDAEIEQLAYAVYTAPSMEKYLAAAQRFQDLWSERVIQMPLFVYGTSYVVRKGLGADKWETGQMGAGVNLAGLVTKPEVVH